MFDNQPEAGSEEALVAKLTAQYSDEAPPEEAQPSEEIDRESDNDEAADDSDTDGEVNGDDSDHDGSDDESDDDDNQDGQSEEEEEYFTVKTGDKEEKLTRKQLIDGYMRQSDYTRKAQELAQQREQSEARAKELGGLQDKLKSVVEETGILATLIEQQLVPQEHLNALLASDPARFVQVNAENEKRKAAIQGLRQRGARAQEDIDGSVKAEQDARISAARSKFVETMPYIKEPENERKFIDYVTKNYGYSVEQIAATDDPNLFVIMEKARKFDEMNAKSKDKPNKVVPKMAKGNAPRQTSKEMRTSKVTDAEKRFKQSGSEKDMMAKLIARYTT